VVRALVLGAYGLIGSACVEALKRQGVEVVGMGRSRQAAQRAYPDIAWIIADICELDTHDWQAHLDGVDIVINAAGALQDGRRDSLEAIHVTAVAALCAAASGRTLRFIQISAAGASRDAATAFFRSKARGDAVVQASDLDWVVLRPTLVIGPNAYGGTALLRGVAGLPGFGVRVFEDSPVQTIALDELAEAVADCALGTMPTRHVYDLTEPDARGFGETVALMRAWLGFQPHRVSIAVPGIIMRTFAAVADCLGWLGWRSPLRTTAVRTIERGVTGDPSAWQAAGGGSFSALPVTLSAMPVTLQERWFARLYVMLPLAIAILSLFWVLSGVVGLWRFDEAVAVLTGRGFGLAIAQMAVLVGSIADILVGALILYRPWARGACLGMAALAFGYMVAATLFAADLWADPLGPMVKVLPAIGLAVIAYAALEER